MSISTCAALRYRQVPSSVNAKSKFIIPNFLCVFCKFHFGMKERAFFICQIQKIKKYIYIMKICYCVRTTEEEAGQIFWKKDSWNSCRNYRLRIFTYNYKRVRMQVSEVSMCDARLADYQVKLQNYPVKTQFLCHQFLSKLMAWFLKIYSTDIDEIWLTSYFHWQLVG